MKWKRYMMATVCLVIISGSVVSCGFVRHPRHEIRSKRATNVVFLRMDNEATRLGLTQAQEEEYERLKKRVTLAMERDFDRFRRTPDEALTLFDEEDPGFETVVEGWKRRMAQAEDPRGKYLDYLVEFYNILDERQKGLFMEDLKKELERADRFHRTRRWG
ncbi:MAG: hypothetical protein JXQ30_15310 [Spirochaetes bacterium]|nr:hypothetical protein [Spirochaetota bacterium]